jgi:DNA-directed RNA polymerase subunit F
MNRFTRPLTVTVDKKQLIEKLTTNLKNHKKKYQQAYASWKKESIEALKKAIKNVENDKQLIGNILDVMPQDKSDEYEDAIRMLEWDTNNTIELDQQQFNAFINDEWDWSQHWTTVNTKYFAG